MTITILQRTVIGVAYLPHTAVLSSRKKSLEAMSNTWTQMHFEISARKLTNHGRLPNIINQHNYFSQSAYVDI